MFGPRVEESWRLSRRTWNLIRHYKRLDVLPTERSCPNHRRHCCPFHQSAEVVETSLGGRQLSQASLCKYQGTPRTRVVILGLVRWTYLHIQSWIPSTKSSNPDNVHTSSCWCEKRGHKGRRSMRNESGTIMLHGVGQKSGRLCKAVGLTRVSAATAGTF